MKLKHKSSCDCLECEFVRRSTEKQKQERETQRKKIQKRLGISHRRETLGRLIEDGLNGFYYSDKAKEFLSVNENLLEWLHICIENAHNAQDRFISRNK